MPQVPPLLTELQAPMLVPVPGHALAEEQATPVNPALQSHRPVEALQVPLPPQITPLYVGQTLATSSQAGPVRLRLQWQVPLLHCP